MGGHETPQLIHVWDLALGFMATTPLTPFTGGVAAVIGVAGGGVGWDSQPDRLRRLFAMQSLSISLSIYLLLFFSSGIFTQGKASWCCHQLRLGSLSKSKPENDGPD